MPRTSDALRFEVRVRKETHPELYKALFDAGPYQRSKLMVAVASASIMARQGLVPIALPVAAVATTDVSSRPQKRNKPTIHQEEKSAAVDTKSAAPDHPPAEKPRYVIPDDSVELIGGLFSDMGLDTNHAELK